MKVKMAQGPCLNPNCNSAGRPHPNCRCYEKMAEGGVAGCNGPHDPKCKYHLPSDPSEIFQNAVSHQGLSNLIKQSSKSPLDTDENKHRGFDNYIDANRKGAKKYGNVIGSSLSKGKQDLSANPEDLQQHFDDFNSNPDSTFETGSSISNVSPIHAADLATTVGAASSYLQSIKPASTPNGPLSNPIPVSDLQMRSYERQVHLVEQPLHIVEHIKNGTLLPKDIQTISAVYPKMYNRLKASVMEHIIDTKEAKKEIPYSQRLSLSMFLGQPMDPVMSQPAMLAAITANAPKPPPQPPQGKSKGSSKTAATQQDKVQEMLETTTQSLQQKKD